MLRIGEGYDVHKLVSGRDLILAGVKIPYEKGLLGHSDADVLIHAIMDSLLGALSMGDIGKHFPDNDDKFKDISSIVLLKTVSELILEHAKAKNSSIKTIEDVINNIDATIMCEKPKLRPYIDEMRKNISNAINIPVDRVSIKATTEEGLGFTGEGLGISARAICLINA